MDGAVRKGFPEELALKATSEGQEGANHMKTQKNFSGRGSSVCQDPGVGKSWAYQKAEGRPEWLLYIEQGGSGPR